MNSMMNLNPYQVPIVSPEMSRDNSNQELFKVGSIKEKELDNELETMGHQNVNSPRTEALLLDHRQVSQSNVDVVYGTRIELNYFGGHG